MSILSKKNIWITSGVAGLLCVLMLQLILSVRRNSITWDEDDHIYAGYMSWKHADFGLNPEHPPLVKMLAALPLLNMPLTLPPLQNRNFKHEAFLGGKDFIFKNNVDASAGRLVLVGLATGLALASKHTAIVVFPMLLLLAIWEVARRGSPAETGLGALPRETRTLRLSIALVIISAIAIVALWASYGFRYQARADGWQLNPPLAEFVHNLSRPREVRLLETVARWRLLPESYIYGLADVRIMSDF